MIPAEFRKRSSGSTVPSTRVKVWVSVRQGELWQQREGGRDAATRLG